MTVTFLTPERRIRPTDGGADSKAFGGAEDNASFARPIASTGRGLPSVAHSTVTGGE